MRFAILLAVTLGCGSPLGKVRTIGGAQVRVQLHDTGSARLVGFVARPSPHGGAGASFAMVLPGGDWLGYLNGALVRMAPDGLAARWTKRGVVIWEAVTAGDRIVAVGTIADPKALNGERRSMFALDLATGDVAWSAEADAIRRGAHARLVRAGSITVAASAYGEAAVDDTGAVRWSQSRKESSLGPLLGPGGGHTVVVVTARQLTTSELGDTPRHVPLLVRTLDVETGAERGRHELPAMGDMFGFGALAVAGDGRLAIDVSDITWTKQEVVIDGTPSIASSQDATPRLIVIDPSDPAKPRVESIARPERTEGPMPAKLAPSEVAFLDRYATPAEPLGVTIVDLATLRAHRAIVMRPQRIQGVDSYVQILQLTADLDRLTFAGIFAGTVTPLRAIVREIDACEAAGFIECSEGVRTTIMAPSAGVIGTIRIPR